MTRNSAFLSVLWAARLLIVFGLILPVQLYAHGALIELTHTAGIAIQARYDTGQPMAEAQVSIFAPDNPAKPWATGQTDTEGRFAFVPDPTIPGTWAVQARQAGHGAMAHIRVGDVPEAAATEGSDLLGNTTAFPPSPQSLTTLQRILVIASVVWGCLGTALFFSRGRTGLR